tara:strand:+ start:276 stop:422 length:147 start_codon:yes stop_codon:yes gene_type:complete
MRKTLAVIEVVFDSQSSEVSEWEVRERIEEMISQDALHVQFWEFEADA